MNKILMSESSKLTVGAELNLIVSVISRVFAVIVRGTENISRVSMMQCLFISLINNVCNAKVNAV